MDDRSLEDRRAGLRRLRLDECRGRQFVRATFASYPALRSIEPGAWDEHDAYHVSRPQTGQDQEAGPFEVVDGGWDHEHCHVCDARIEPGDEYWQCVDPHPLELCLGCQPQLAADA